MWTEKSRRIKVHLRIIEYWLLESTAIFGWLVLKYLLNILFSYHFISQIHVCITILNANDFVHFWWYVPREKVLQCEPRQQKYYYYYYNSAFSSRKNISTNLCCRILIVVENIYKWHDSSRLITKDVNCTRVKIVSCWQKHIRVPLVTIEA